MKFLYIERQSGKTGLLNDQNKGIMLTMTAVAKTNKLSSTSLVKHILARNSMELDKNYFEVYLNCLQYYYASVMDGASCILCSKSKKKTNGFTPCYSSVSLDNMDFQ